MNTFEDNASMTLSGIQYAPNGAESLGTFGGLEIHRLETASHPMHRCPPRAVKWRESAVAHAGLFWLPRTAEKLAGTVGGSAVMDRLDEIAEESAATYNRNAPAEPLPEEPEEMPAPWAHNERTYVNYEMGHVLTDYEWARYLELLTGYMAQQNALEMRAGGKLDHLR